MSDASPGFPGVGQRELIGEQVGIRPVEHDDLPCFLRWWNDPALMREVLAEDFSIAADELERVYWPAWRAPGPHDQHMFIISLAGQAIGELAAERPRDAPETLILHIKIADPSRWGLGLGTDALRTFIRAAFEDPSLARVVIEPGAHNQRMQTVCAKLGMRRRTCASPNVPAAVTFELPRSLFEAQESTP